MARSMAVVALLTLVGMMLWGCNQPTDNGGDPDPDDWALRTSPQNVLENLISAYENKDVEHYVDCLAADFTFWMNEQEVIDHPEYLPGYWDKASERQIHEAMFGEGGAETITLTLTQVGDPVEIEPPHPGDPVHWEYSESVDLRVHVHENGVPTTYWATAPSKFEFRIDEDQVGPSGETLWEIVNWHDEPGGRESRSSWGSIKALYF